MDSIISRSQDDMSTVKCGAIRALKVQNYNINNQMVTFYQQYLSVTVAVSEAV
jgi:hypothetical protein